MNKLQMNKQFEKLTVQILFKNKISIRTLFILDDDRYLYQIMNNCVEEWYMIHDDTFLKLNIVKHITDKKKTRKIIFDLGEKMFMTMKMHYELNENGHDKISIKLNKNGIYYAIKDNYLYEMFFDIHRMNN